MELKTTEDVNSRSMANLPAYLTRNYCIVYNLSTDNIISWDSDCGFTVRNAYEICRDLLPKYFNHNSFTIFILQLCIAGFRVTTKEDGLEYKFAKGGVGSRGLLRWEIMTDFLCLGQEVRELEHSIVKMIRKSKNQDPSEEFETTDALMEIRRAITEIKEKIHNMSLQSPLEVASSPDPEIRHPVRKKIEAGMREVTIAKGLLEDTFSKELVEIEQVMPQDNMAYSTPMQSVLCVLKCHSRVHLYILLLDMLISHKRLLNFFYAQGQGRIGNSLFNKSQAKAYSDLLQWN